MADSIARSIAKTITWRITALVITFAIAFFITDNVSFAVGISIFDMFVKSFVYFLHERAWIRLDRK